MRTLFFILLISVKAIAALTIEDLKSTFLTKAEIGPMSYEKLIELEDALIDIGRDDIIIKLQDKLQRHNISFLSSIIHVCELEDDTLGTYQRGSSTIYTQALSPDADTSDLRVFWGRGDILDNINSAYKYHTTNNGIYASLVVMEWPVICIRPEKMLANNLATFAHEVEHYLGDEEKALDITKYESEADFVIKNLYKSGGEFDAYQAGALLYHNLYEEIGYETPQSFMRFFDHEGIVIDPQGLEKFILNDLGYEVGFKNIYRKQIIDSYNEEVNDYNNLTNWFELYAENLRISEYNESVYLKNIEVYDNNIAYYTHYRQMNKVAELEEKKQLTQASLAETIKAKNFYANIIELKASSLSEAQREIGIIQDLILKLRRDSASTQN